MAWRASFMCPARALLAAATRGVDAKKFGSPRLPARQASPPMSPRRSPADAPSPARPLYPYRPAPAGARRSVLRAALAALNRLDPSQFPRRPGERWAKFFKLTDNWPDHLGPP